MADLDDFIDRAEPGRLMGGTIALYKGAAGQLVCVAQLEDGETLRWMVPPMLMRALAGKGPGAKILHKFFGGMAPLAALADGEPDGD